MTRTLFVGEPTARDLDDLRARRAGPGGGDRRARGARSRGRAGRAAERPRRSTAIARDVIDGRRPRRPFGHGLGHGIGLATHEVPSLGRRARRRRRCRRPTVFSVEPGIYLEGETGVRIEDLVALDAGARPGRAADAVPARGHRRRRLSRPSATDRPALLQSGADHRSAPPVRAPRPRRRHQEPSHMISTGELQEGRRHRARRRALADPRLPPHQDGPRLGPGPDHAAQHQARPDGRALVPGRDEVAARLDGEAARSSSCTATATTSTSWTTTRTTSSS